MKGLEGMSYGARLRALGLSHLESRRLRGSLPVLCSSLRREAQREVLLSARWGQWLDAQGWHAPGPGEDQPGHEGKFLRHEGGQMMGQAS